MDKEHENSLRKNTHIHKQAKCFINYQGMQKLNKEKESASNSMCMLLAMNTAGFQLIPATVIAILAANGSTSPTEIIVPTLIVTSTAFISAILIAKFFQKVFPPQIEKEADNAD